MSAELTPIDIVAVLQRALADCGVQASPWSLVEACRGDLSLDSFAHCARQQGLDATILGIQRGDVSYLPVGAIVALEGGGLATLVAHHPGGALLQSPDGTRHRAGLVRPKMALHIRPPPPDGKSFLARLAFRLRREPHATRAIVLSSVVAVALVGLSLAGPALTHVALGMALPDRAEKTLTLVAVATAVLGLNVAFVGWLRGRALLYLSTKFSEITSVDVVAHMVRQPFATLRNRDLGYVRQAATSAAAAAEAIPTLAPQLVDGGLGVAFLAYTFVLDTTTGLVAGGAGLVAVMAGVINGRRRLYRRRELLERTRAEQRALFETIAGIETVKSESVEGRMLAGWLDALLAEESSALDLRLQTSAFATLLVALERIAFAAAVLLMARRCLAGGASIADLVVAVQATAIFMACARRLAELPAALSDYRSDVERADEALGEPIEKEAGAQKPAEATGPAIVLRDVWFRYEPSAPWVIRGLDLVVEPGESVMLSWPSGAGKSTLLRLLSGLLSPSRGDVLVFGVEAAQARRMITYIPQQATLFPMSVMDNLRILSRGAAPRRIIAAAEATGLLEVVSTWAMKMDTGIAFGGANVSSGQKQLILLTAAVASESPFILLDEALAHIDLKMRSRLDTATLFAGRTLISVVHDASSHEQAHARIVELSSQASSPKLLSGA